MTGDGAGPLEAALRASRDRGRKLLLPYVTGGLDDRWTDVLRAIADAGADAVEVGIPFSDPAMDGPTIEEASVRSLARGTTPAAILGELAAVDAVMLAAPVTPDDRLRQVAERSRGFVYAVSVMGITGARDRLASSAAVLAGRLKAITDRPVIIGFGIATPEQAVAAAAHSDGVVVASALMRARLDGATPEQLGERVAELRAALDRG